MHELRGYSVVFSDEAYVTTGHDRLLPRLDQRSVPARLRAAHRHLRGAVHPVMPPDLVEAFVR